MELIKSKREEGGIKSFGINLSNSWWDEKKKKHRWVLTIYFGLRFWSIWPDK